jgi:hypothetical protein
MGIEGELQAKGIHNVFNTVITDSFPNLKKEMSIQVQEASRTTDLTNEPLHGILSLK